MCVVSTFTGSSWAEHARVVLGQAGHHRGAARDTIIDLLAAQSCALSALEIEDRLRAGDRHVARASVYRVLELLQWGASFDKKIGNPYDLAFTREGGHSFARIVHAYGDATGKELAQTLINNVKSHENIRVSEMSFVIDLLAVH